MKVTILTLGIAMLLAACSSVPAQPTDEDTPESDSMTVLQDTTWQWVSMAETEPASQSVVPTPESYTIVFLPDGELSMQADCNIVGGSYTLDDKNLSIQQDPSTMAFCGEESLDVQYLEFLSKADSFTLEDGELVLELKDGAGWMTFRAE